METVTDIKEFVLAGLSARSSVSREALAGRLETDYLSASLLDSLALVEFIVEIEDTLSIELDFQDFEDPLFKTIGGLISILESKAPPHHRS